MQRKKERSILYLAGEGSSVLNTFPLSIGYNANLCGFNPNMTKIYKPWLKEWECHNFQHYSDQNENCYIINLPFSLSFSIPRGWGSYLLSLCLLDGIFLSSYEAGFIQSLLSTGNRQHISATSHTGIHDLLSIGNQDFENYLGQIYPLE